MSAFSAKRQREDDHEGPKLEWERDRKKLRPLPFRTSPTSKHTTLFSQTHQFLSVDIPPTITPGESSDDDDNGMSDMMLSPRSQSAKKDDMPFLSIRVQECPDTDSDLEMTDQPRSANPVSPWSAGLGPGYSGSAVPSPIPHRLITQSLNISGGRTATPIYDHFNPNMNVDAMTEDNAASDPSTTTFSNSLLALTDGEIWWRRRRLPSPISEDEVSPTTPFPKDNRLLKPKVTRQPTSPFSDVWEGIPSHQISSEQQQQPWTPHPLNQNKGANEQYAITSHPHPHSDHRDTSVQNWRDEAIRITTPEPPPVSNDSTPRPSRTKLSIAMGYRADCDKCQRRLPGHYSHIVRG
ncbi:hypothetical protein AJ79_03494 [Helicocarpus griseus UAMH5409]|uniref:Uncharacterized protein n=1 Tax=Helicocarpus griseus UAMH5409 TaxID=1447875 RepID=A0A2B7XWR1_9EURO|nr:hypothetical protein AJ79_03494 [Helicocarpus griseus UAMH5409]